MTLLHIVAAAMLVSSVIALRLPDLGSKIDLKSHLSKVAVHSSCYVAGRLCIGWCFISETPPWSLQDFAERFGGCRLPDSDFLEGAVCKVAVAICVCTS